MNLVNMFTRLLGEYTSPVLRQDSQSQETMNLVER